MLLQGELLDDLQRLHVPSLTWMGPPPEVLGRPGRALRSIAGHSFSGLVAFGGCIATALGIVPIAKMDVLLIGVLQRADVNGSGAAMSKVSPRGRLPQWGLQTRGFHVRLGIVVRVHACVVMFRYIAPREWRARQPPVLLLHARDNIDVTCLPSVSPDARGHIHAV